MAKNSTQGTAPKAKMEASLNATSSGKNEVGIDINLPGGFGFSGILTRKEARSFGKSLRQAAKDSKA